MRRYAITSAMSSAASRLCRHYDGGLSLAYGSVWDLTYMKVR